VKDLVPDDRPREKLARHGAGVLGDNELLALVIGHGPRHVGALSVANAVLAASGGVQGLPRLHGARLERISGVGRAQAARILAAVELGRRTLTTPEHERPRFRTPEDAGTFLLPRFGAYPVERFGALLLDTKYRLVATRLLSVGGLDASLAHPRELFREALLTSAAVVVAFHNHPSGDPTPSDDDVALTKRLKLAGGLVGVALLDHIVLGNSRYCSMRQMGMI
jgi:DNA repair protein RadC